MLFIDIIFLNICLFLIFLIWGNFFIYKLNIGSGNFGTSLIYGYLLYFSVFQCIAEPLIFLKQKLSCLQDIWILITIILTLIFFRELYIKKGVKIKKSIKQFKDINVFILGIIALGIIILYLAFTAIDVGRDAVEYIGSIAGAVDTNTMFQFSGYSGGKNDVLNSHFSLSAFYMHSAILCRMTGLHSLIVQRYVMGTILVYESLAILWEIITQIVKKQNKQLLAMIYAELMLIFFQTSYSGNGFLFGRSIEAKAHCAMIICPMLFAIYLRLVRNINKNDVWICLFLCAFASVPVSMSSMLIVPIGIFVFTISLFIYHKNSMILIKGCICCIPNVLYGILYFLMQKGLIMIKI